MAAGAFDLKAFYARVDGLYRDGRGDEVYRYLADSLAAARRSGDPLAIVAVASELGGVERVRGNLRQAEALYDEALLLHGRMPSPDAASSANLLINKGDVLVAQGRYAAAVALVSLAQTLVKEGRLDEARREIDAALRAYETLSGGRDIHRPNAFACSGQIAYLMGDYRLAADQLHRAAEALRDKVGASPMVERLQEDCRRMQRLADA